MILARVSESLNVMKVPNHDEYKTLEDMGAPSHKKYSIGDMDTPNRVEKILWKSGCSKQEYLYFLEGMASPN